MIATCHVQRGRGHIIQGRAKWKGKRPVNQTTCQALSIFLLGSTLVDALLTASPLLSKEESPLLTCVHCQESYG